MPLQQVCSPSSLEHLARVHTSTLTRSTAAVAGVLAVGLSDSDSAIALNLSIHTVRNHIVSLSERIGGSAGTIGRVRLWSGCGSTEAAAQEVS